MTTTLVRILVIFVMGAASSASPQRQTAAPAPGAGVIRGRVVTGDTSAPLRDVVVSLRPADQLPAARPGTGGEVAPPGAPATRPDPNGRFEFVGVAAGRYRIAVDPGPTAARYLPVRYPDPSAEDPAPLAISGDQVLDQIVIAYRFDGLRPGRYLIVATSRDESAGLSAPYLELLARHATPFVVGEAESKSVDLKRVTLK